MRYPVILLIVLLLPGCGTRSAHEDAEIITKIGLIKSKQDADMQQVERDTGVNTSVHASISSGGRISIGLGFLLSQFNSGGSDPEPVRYEVELEDGGQMTIYHDSRDFEVDDCVRITVHPDEEKHPPTMRRYKDGCG